MEQELPSTDEMDTEQPSGFFNTRSALDDQAHDAELATAPPPPGQDNPRATFGEGYVAAKQQGQITHTLDRAGEFNWKVDPNWELDSDRLETDMKERDLDDMPMGWVSELAVMKNEDDYNTKLGQLQQRKADNAVIQSMGGWRGFGAQLAAYATDPVAASIDVFTGGFGRGATTGARVLNGGLRGMAAHGVIEGILASDGDLPDPGGAAIGFGAAFVLGGAGSWLLGDAPKATEPLRKHLSAIREDGAPEATHGPRGGDSAGAARNELLPDRIPNVDMEASDIIRWALEDLYPESGRPETVLNKFKFDASTQTQRGTNSLTKAMGDAFFPDSSSTRGQLGAVEASDKFRGRLDAPWQQEMGSAFLDFQKNHSGNRSYGKVVDYARAAYALDARDEFADRVGKHIFTGQAGDEVAEVKRAAKAFNDMTDTSHDILTHARVKGAGSLKEKGTYGMPRMKNNEGINKLASEVDSIDNALTQLIEESMFRAATRELGDAALDIADEAKGLFKASAKSYARWLQRRNDTAIEDIDNLDLDLAQVETFDDLKTFITKNLDDEAEITEATEMLNRLDPKTSENVELIRSLFHSTTPDATPDRLKFRLDLDHATEIEYRSGGSGPGRIIRMTDIYETNIDKVAFNYQRWVAGESSLASLTDGRVNSSTLRASIEEAREAVEHSKGGQFADAPTQKDVDLMDFMYRSTMGLKMDDLPDNFRRGLALVRNASYVSRMGMAWTHSFGESMAQMAMAGPGRYIKNMSALKEISREIRGVGGEGLVRDLQMYTSGLGKSLVRNMGQLRYELDSTSRAAGVFRKVEDVMEGTKRLASVGNMLSYSTDMMREYSSVLALRQLDDFLVGGKKVPKWWRNRADTWTLTPDREKLIAQHLKDNTVRDKKGVIKRIKAGTQEQQEAFSDFMYRYVSDGVQHLNAGNLPRQMQNPIMKLIFQFRSWEMGSWHRHTLKDLHMRDRVGAAKFMSSSLVASLAYIGRTHWTAAGNQEDLDKNLTMERIVASGVGYSVNAGILPAVVDSVTSMVGTGPVIRPVRTTGVASGLGIDGFAATKLYEDWESVVKLPFRQLRHLATEGGLDSLNRDEARSLFAVAFMDTMWFVRPFKEWFVDQHETKTEKASNSNLLGLE